MEEEEVKDMTEEEEGSVVLFKHAYSLEWTISTPIGTGFQVKITHEDPEKAKAIALELFEKSKTLLGGSSHGPYSV